jgi:hypothetical protein
MTPNPAERERCGPHCCRGDARFAGRSAGLRPEPESPFRLGLSAAAAIARDYWQLGAFAAGVIALAAINISMGNW